MVLATQPPPPDGTTYTVQNLPDAKQYGVSEFGLWSIQTRGPLLAAWGTRQRERELRRLYRHDYNWMVQGAFAGVMKLIASTPWEIKGPSDLSTESEKYYRRSLKAMTGKATDTERPDIEYYQAILRHADFGRGWTSFLQKGVDYLRQDGGWFWEVLAPGDPSKAPTGAIAGIAHLDSIRCIPTGDPEYPVYYIDRMGKWHLLHKTRIRQIVDMPDGDEERPGYGLCALSRAVSIAYREILMGRYIEASLDDKPAPGIIKTNINDQFRNAALAAYRADQERDEQLPWGKQLWVNSPDVSIPLQLDPVAFSVAPEKFDYKAYTELDVDALALALGVDKQDLWQLTGGTLGSGTQSEVLHQKARGKTVGTLRAQIEREVNDLFPDDYEFVFKYQDEQEDETRARIANLWGDFVAKAGSHLDDMEARRVLANQVEAVKDAITDASGEITRRNDADVPGEQGEVVDDAAAPQTGGSQQPATNGTKPPVAQQEKLIQATRLQFEDAFADIIKARVEGTMNAQRFGIVARGLLRRYGLQAFRDGLEDGGVSPYTAEGAPLPLDFEEALIYNSWLIQQSIYVTAFGKTLTAGLQIADYDARAGMWWNKSIKAMYEEGRASADANGLYQFIGDDGEESCNTCIRLKWQVHRMKDWRRKRLRPGVDTANFICKGFACHHYLVRVTGKASGRW